MGIEQQIRKLQEKFHALNGIEFNQYNKLLAVDINNDSAEATIFLQGAQISKYQPKGQAPVLWLSEYCEFRKGSPYGVGFPFAGHGSVNLRETLKRLKNNTTALSLRMALCENWSGRSTP